MLSHTSSKAIETATGNHSEPLVHYINKVFEEKHYPLENNTKRKLPENFDSRDRATKQKRFEVEQVILPSRLPQFSPYIQPLVTKVPPPEPRFPVPVSQDNPVPVSQDYIELFLNEEYKDVIPNITNALDPFHT